jgi:PAS domain-containing protein
VFTAEATNAYDASIAAIDPLDADELITHLPEANTSGDVDWLTATAHDLAERTATIESAPEACAALRDLGLVVASLGRHRPQALEKCPWQAQLLRLGALADEVPRETVYSYASRNPEGPRQRRFTDTVEERMFIANVTSGIRHLNHAVEVLVGYAHAPDQGNTLAELLTELDSRLREFASCLLKVKRTVSPEFFTNRLRPYFPPLTIHEHTYFGPGGAQMPQLVLDVLLLRPKPAAPLAKWHETYIEDNAIYLPASHRRLIDESLLVPSGLVARMAGPAAATGVDEGALTAMRTVVASILRFRYPHQRMAAANMTIRPSGALGSGGYSLEAVDQLVELTTYALTQLDRTVTP